MNRFYLMIIFSLFITSCISYNIKEKDLFNNNKVSELNNDIQLEENYIITSDSVKLYTWFVKQKDAKGTILYFGGNGFYLWNRLTPDVINMLTSFKMNLMLIDYRGYGRSEGEPTIKGIYNDGISSYKYLCSREDIDSTKIIVYGHSLGTFVATRVGNSYPVAGIILEGAISNAKDMQDVALEYNAPWYLRWLVSIDADSVVKNLDNLEQLKKLNHPTLVIVGERDNIAPPEMGRKVYETVSSSIKEFRIIPNGEHKDLYFSNKDGRQDNYKSVVSSFLDKILLEK